MNRLKASSIYCEYDNLEEDSDQERGLDSSDDDIDVILNGTPKQKRKLSRSLSEGSLDVLSSGDEFEKEMEMELEDSMRKYQTQQSKLAAANSDTKCLPSVGASGSSSDDKKYYDEVYFDSDEEEGAEQHKDQRDDNPTLSAKSKKRQLVQSNEDLFYDPDIDDQNQKWVDNQRSRYYPSKPGTLASLPTKSSTAQKRLKSPSSETERGGGPKSDAILNCPACMATLCLDCQRHEIYPTQYRAMFVLNCAIIRSETLKYKPGEKKKRKWKKKSKSKSNQEDDMEATSSTNDGTEESYHPVKCAECNTEVAVYDSDEVYHFFNVITGVA
ncbi:putative E2F-associated phosphoprotein-like [Apostichopus japonicus]|uniref:Putative E2F-associated phosphoprotein-like n=1 Tax=Stichopus japonicus TaxID=307972 RepID=A0A2G8LB43_STIJA|nr:putative E2F-associated phosphoprotein-like [Apostichopus japonicus]